MNGLDSSFISSPYPNQVNFITAINVNGQTAGNISSGASTWQSGTAGIDCSGLICQAFQIETKYSCSGLINSGYAHLTDWDSILPGDIGIRTTGFEHTFMIFDVIYLSSGQINKVLTYESTRDASQKRAQLLAYTLDALGPYNPYIVY